MAKPKDSQWGKFTKVMDDLCANEPKMTERELQEFADKVIRSRWFGNRRTDEDVSRSLPRPHVQIRTDRARGNYCEPSDDYHGNWTHHWYPVPKRSNRYGVLHAIAHLLVPKDKADHGPEFAHLFVLAVGRYIGKNEELRARSLMRQHKVKLYTWSADARQRASERKQEERFKAAGEGLAALAASLEGEDW